MPNDEANKKNWLVVYQLQPSWVVGVALERYGIRTPLPTTKADADAIVTMMKRRPAFKHSGCKVFALQIPDESVAAGAQS